MRHALVRSTVHIFAWTKYEKKKHNYSLRIILIRPKFAPSTFRVSVRVTAWNNYLLSLFTFLYFFTHIFSSWN